MAERVEPDGELEGEAEDVNGGSKEESEREIREREKKAQEAEIQRMMEETQRKAEIQRKEAEERLAREQKRRYEEITANNEATVFVFEGDEGEPDEKKQKDDDATYEPSPKKVTSRKTDRNLTPLPALSEACDRYDLNNGAAAFIANATLQDYGLLSKSTAIDRKKLARERIKWRRRTKEEDEKSKNSEESGACIQMVGGTLL